MTAADSSLPIPAHVESLVLGGGLAGSATAIALARAGRQVVLVEREAGPHHKVCGEFLSAEALLYLGTLGVDPAALGAVPLHEVRVAGRFSYHSCPLPFAAMSLTRRRLDEALLLQAAAAGATLLRGQSVQALERTAASAKWSDAGLWQATLSDGAQLASRNVFVATGKHDLRGYPRPQGAQSGMLALKMYWRLASPQTAALAGAVELFAYRGGYAGLQPVEGGLANLCCLVSTRRFARLGRRWPLLLAAVEAECPQLAARLLGGEPMLERPLSIASIPYGFVREHTDGLWHLGDQAAVIPSFTGDGMSLALHAAASASRLYLAGASAADFQQQLASDVRRQVGLATRLAQVLVRLPRISLAALRLWPGALGTIALQSRIAPEFLPA